MPQYQGIWTLAQAAQLQSTQRWATDPLFENTTLLLQADNAANGAQNNTFIDSSSNNFTITRNGNTTQGTFTPFSQSPGYWGNFFTGTSSLAVPAGSAFAYGTGAFTIEVWINPSTYQAGTFAGGQIFTQTASGQNYLTLGIGGTGGVGFTFGSGGGTGIGTSFSAAPLGSWTHIAIVREGTGANQLKIYVNGVLAQTGTCSFDFTNTSYNPTVANYTHEFTQLPFGGYISNLRVVKGVAVYTGNFSPPTSPLTATQSAGTNIAAITGTQTSLLTCQSTRFIDNSVANSGSGWTVSIGGTPSVQAFSPFAPQYQWTAPVIGGSGYFDGNGDFLTIANNANLQVSGNVDMFVEAFIYLNTTGGKTVITKSGITGSSYPNWTLAINTSNKAAFVVSNSGSPGTLILNLAGATTLTIGQWYHLVGTKRYVGGGSVNEYRLFVNGVLDAFNTAANISDPRAANLSIGVEGSSTDYMNGYVQSLRFSNSNIPTSYQTTSTTVGATIFTPPTAPVTTTSQGASNVQLLLNFTNAGIYDGTMKNNLETVGNAQVSTSVVKYGTGSMYFDGTGDYLTSNPATTDLYAFGSGDFTIEMWLRLNSVTGTQVFYDQRPLAGGVYPTLYMSGSTLFYYTNGANRITGATLAIGQWYHIAVSRSGTSTRLFVDGTQSGSTYTDTNVYLNAALRPFIGGDGTNIGTGGVNGYIDDLRITKGIARYTANFIPPSVALPRQ